MTEKHELDRLADDGGPHAELPHDQTNHSDYDAETVQLILVAERRACEAEAEWEECKREASEAKKLMESRVAEVRGLIRDREAARGVRNDPTLLDMVVAEQRPAWRDVPIDKLKIDKGIKAQLSFDVVKTAGELYDEITSFNPADGTPFGLALGDVAEIRMVIQQLIDAETMPPALTGHPDLWREYPIERWEQFGVTPKDIEKLAAGEVKRESGRTPVVTVGDLSNFSTPTASGYTRGYADMKGIGAAGADRISAAEMAFWNWWGNGGDTEFARERGLTNGNAPIAGTGISATPAPAGTTDEDDAATDPDATDLYENPVVDERCQTY